MNASETCSREKPLRRAVRLRRRPLGGYRYVRMRWRVLFACIDAAGAACAYLTRLLLPRRSYQTSEGEPRRILVVQFDHLGDAVITTAIFKPLRQRYPDALIDVLAAPWNREIFERVPEVNQVHVCRHNRFACGGSGTWIAATVVWGLRMRRRRYDLAVDVRGELPHNVLLWLTGARRRLGWANGGGGFLLTDMPAFVVNRPEVDSRAALLECLGIRCRGGLQPTLTPTLTATESAEMVWKEFGTADGHARIVLHIGAGTSAKRWPTEHWRTLVEHLTSEKQAIIALVGTSGDRSTAQSILGISSSAHVADWTGRFSVDELAAVLQSADVLIGADSGPAHLAAAVGTPVVALFSGTNSVEQWQPRGARVAALRCDVSCSPCHRRSCPVAGHPCMRGIQPGRVVATLTNLLPADSFFCPAALLPHRSGT